MKNIISFLLFLFLLADFSGVKAQDDLFRMGYWGIFPAPDTAYVSIPEKILLENSGANVIQAWLLSNEDHTDSYYNGLIGNCNYSYPIRHIEDVWFNYLDSLNAADPQNAVYHIVGYNTGWYKTSWGGKKQFYYYGKHANEVKTSGSYNSGFMECLNFYTQPVSGFAWRDGFGGYYVDHEKAYSSEVAYLEGLRYMCSKIKEKDPNHLIVSSGNIQYMHTQFPSMMNDSLDVFQSQKYPFRHNTIFDSYSDDYQKVILKDAIDNHYQATMEKFSNTNINWWVIIQVSKCKEDSIMVLRYPSGPEMFMQAYLAITRNAKGVLGFIYGDNVADTTSSAYYRAPLNLWWNSEQPRTEKLIVGSPPYTEYNMYDTLTVLFSELKTYGPTLMKLQTDQAFLATAEYGAGIPAESYIKGVTGQYIEAAAFNRTDGMYPERDYFMLVNRICNSGNVGEIGIPASPQKITVTIKKSSKCCYTIKDILNNRTYLFFSDENGEFNFTYTLLPGRGRLFELSYYGNNWDGEFYISNNLTIPENHHVNIQPGSVLKFDTSKRFYIYGHLDAYASEQDSILFTWINDEHTQYYWGGIKVAGSGSQAYLAYCSLKHASTMLEFSDGGTGYVGFCDFFDVSTGINVSYSDPYIEYCTISDISNYGIRIYHSFNPQNWSAVNLSNNTVMNGNNIGIYLIASSPTLSENILTNNAKGIFTALLSNLVLNHNVINSNDHHGVMCAASSSPDIYYNPHYSTGGYNEISYNNINGVCIMGGSYPILGIAKAGNYDRGGYNTIKENSEYEVANYTDSTIYAQNNWWGQAYGPPLKDGPTGPKLYGSVAWYPALSSPPGDKNSASSSDKFAVDTVSILPEELQIAYYEQMSTNYEKAAGQFKDFFITNGESAFAVRSAIEYYKNLNCFKTADEIYKELEESKNKTKNKNVQFQLFYSQITMLVRMKNFDRALKNIDQALESEITQDQKNRLLLQKALIYVHDLNDSETGEKYLNEIINNSSKNDGFYEIASVELDALSCNSAKSPNLAKGSLKESSENPIELPKKYLLLGNYPNPFNPQTTIRFMMPYLSNIRLNIYNIMGQHIKEIEISCLPAGYSEIVWDGTNSFGNPVSSGLYIYHFLAESLEGNNKQFEKSAKILLVR